MQGAAAPPIQPVVPSRKPIAAALVALIAGGAIATGVWWLTDNDVDILPQPDSVTRVIVSPSVEPGSGTVAKNEAQTAAAVGVSPPVIGTGTGTAVKNEAGSAAAIGSRVRHLGVPRRCCSRRRHGGQERGRSSGNNQRQPLARPGDYRG